MTTYQAKINKVTFYTTVVRIDSDGQESVDACYKGRHFSTLKAAEKSTNKYIESIK